MEPRRLRSAGLQRPIMLPDVFHRGGPRIQEQTFGTQTSQKEAIAVLRDTTAITEEEANKLIGRINPKIPVNIYTMGTTTAEARAQYAQNQKTQRSPAQSNGPSQQNQKDAPTNHPATVEISTLAQTKTDNNNAAQRRRRIRRPRSRSGVKGRSTTEA